MFPVVNLFIKEEFLESRLVLILIEKPSVGRGMGGISQCKKEKIQKIRPGDGGMEFKAKDNTHSQIQGTIMERKVDGQF